MDFARVRGFAGCAAQLDEDAGSGEEEASGCDEQRLTVAVGDAIQGARDDGADKEARAESARGQLI